VQVLFRAKLDDSPIRELARERLAELFAVLEPRALSGCIAMRNPIKVDQRDRAGATSEVVYFKFQPAGPLQSNRRHPPDQKAFFVPTFNGEKQGVLIHRVGIRQKSERIFAGLNQNWFLAGFEKALNRQVSQVRIPALRFPGCGIQRYLILLLPQRDIHQLSSQLGNLRLVIAIEFHMIGR
jgi:hypothetical protein